MIALPSGPHAVPLYSLRQYMAVRRADNPSFSPDGTQIAYVANESGAWQAWVVSAGAANPRKLTKFPHGIAQAQWSPHGDKILVVADQGGDQNYQFFTVDGSTGVVTNLTSDGKVQHNFGGWTPDGKSIFYVDNSRDARYFDCYVMDVETRRRERICQRDSVLRPDAVSPDGGLIAVEEIRSEVDNDILVVDRSTKEARAITPHHEPARFAAIGFSADDTTIYYRSDLGREHLAVLAQNLATGSTKALIGGDADIDYAVLSPDSRTLAISRNRDGYEDLSVWGVGTMRQFPLPPLPKGIVIPQLFSADATKLAVMVNTSIHDDDQYVVDLAHTGVHRVTHSSQGGIDPSSLVLPKLIRYRSFDGRFIPAFLYVPHQASPAHPAPVIVSVHGGPEDQEQPYSTNYYQFLLSRGYAILAPNIRGSTGYGKTYEALDNGPLRWGALKDVQYAVRWIATQSELDGKRAACLGPSYGGFVTLSMLSHYPRLFAGGVDLYGPTDLKTFLIRTAPYRRPNRIAEYGDPVKDSAFMDAISPAKHASNICRPLLVIQGENDPIVPPAESQDIVRLLRKHRRTVDYLFLKAEGHGISSEDDYVRAFDRILSFLRRYLPAGKRP